MIFKFNGGNGAVICEKCGKIVYTLQTMPDEMRKEINKCVEEGKTYDNMKPVYCDECKAKEE